MGRDLPDVSYQKKVPKKGVAWSDLPTTEAFRRPYDSEVQTYSYPQMWGSTALGHGGMGGAAMTTAQTTVVVCNRSAAVYFGRQHAYTILKFNGELWPDLQAHRIVSKDNAAKYGELRNA